ncbi:hypothetical protein E2320_014534 [Naja naja]|nr:hypothetical protein E2320_014534 [Naja naja]
MKVWKRDLKEDETVATAHVDSICWRCSPGYVGDTCQFPDPCTPLLCQNGGSCSSRVLPPSATPEYVCVCPPGFTGEKCQGVVDDPCFPSPCQHGGTCQRISGKEHQCQCLPGWTGFEGHTCQHDINECFASPSPCLNGGSCLNSIGSFRCLCPSNFSGPLCQYRWGLCSSEICLHGGTCHLVDGGYHGCLCYTGQYCEVNPDDCAGHQCLNGGTCQDGIGSYTCHCIQGWTGLLCHLPDACLSNPCHSDAHCDTDLQTGHAICTCQLGYAGALCYEDIDECLMAATIRPARSPAPASGVTQAPGANRTSMSALASLGSGGRCVKSKSVCKATASTGEPGLRCERDADFCRGAPCEHGTCVNVPGSFTCTTLYLFTWMDRPDVRGRGECLQFQPMPPEGCLLEPPGNLPVHLPQWLRATCDADADECSSSPCLNSGTCLNSPGSFHCLCPRGYSGPKCQVTLDLCSDYACKNGGQCRVKRLNPKIRSTVDPRDKGNRHPFSGRVLGETDQTSDPIVTWIPAL